MSATNWTVRHDPDNYWCVVEGDWKVIFSATGPDAEAKARLIAAAPQMQALVEKAVSALSTYIVPDSGITEHNVVNQLLGIFDGPEYRAAMAKAGAA